jgi:DNA-binding response OmpR family regulator
MNESARESSVSALLVGEYETDRPLLKDVFARFGWRLFEARNRRHALQCLARNPVQVVIAESNIPRWHWKLLLEDLRSLAHPPQLIVTSRTADDYLWAEVLNIGGYDVLPRPLDREEVERVIASARRHFDRQPMSVARRPPTISAGAA